MANQLSMYVGVLIGFIFCDVSGPVTGSNTGLGHGSCVAIARHCTVYVMPILCLLASTCTVMPAKHLAMSHSYEDHNNLVRIIAICGSVIM